MISCPKLATQAIVDETSGKLRYATGTSGRTVHSTDKNGRRVVRCSSFAKGGLPLSVAHVAVLEVIVERNDFKRLEVFATSTHPSCLNLSIVRLTPCLPFHLLTASCPPTQALSTMQMRAILLMLIVAGSNALRVHSSDTPELVQAAVHAQGAPANLPPSPHKLMIDADMDVDDMWTIALALSDPRIDVVGITVSPGWSHRGPECLTPSASLKRSP